MNFDVKLGISFSEHKTGWRGWARTSQDISDPHIQMSNVIWGAIKVLQLASRCYSRTIHVFHRSLVTYMSSLGSSWSFVNNCGQLNWVLASHEESSLTALHRRLLLWGGSQLASFRCLFWITFWNRFRYLRWEHPSVPFFIAYRRRMDGFWCSQLPYRHLFWPWDA